MDSMTVTLGSSSKLLFPHSTRQKVSGEIRQRSLPARGDFSLQGNGHECRASQARSKGSCHSSSDSHGRIFFFESETSSRRGRRGGGWRSVRDDSNAAPLAEEKPADASEPISTGQVAGGENCNGSAGRKAEIVSDKELATSLAPAAAEESTSLEGEGKGEGVWQKRWTIVGLCFVAFLLCNMDRVNMSIAVLPMSEEFGWTPSTVGLVQSSFFWGYLLTQVLGGVWADTIGGKTVLGFGVVWWSAATILTPIAAKLGLPVLLFARACMGIGEGVAMPAMNNMLSKWVPVKERSRSLALVYSGMYLGSVLGLSVSPSLIHSFGWPSVFFSFGSLGAFWIFAWQTKAFSSPADDPTLSPSERALLLPSANRASASAAAVTAGGEGDELEAHSSSGGVHIGEEPLRFNTIPWKLLLSKAPVWAIIISHFCHNWGVFILLTWMPTYYHDVLGFTLTESGLFSVLPWLTMAVAANIGGWIADTLISRGWSVTIVRKLMQTIGFVGPAICLSLLSSIKSPFEAVLLLMISQGADAFSQSGLYSNHQDIGPRYAGILLGLSNTAGVLAGVVGTYVTGQILQTGSWDTVFEVAVGLYVVGTIVWNIFSTGERVFD